VTIQGDSAEYDLLIKACSYIKSDNLFTCEIGVREGLGSKIILESFRSKTHWHIGIDPYGNLNYQHYDKKEPYQADYTNKMKSQLVKDLDVPNFTLFQLEDDEFFKRFSDGVPIYRERKILMKAYDLVHFDGPHTTEAVLKEALFFSLRAKENCVFVFDDYKTYNMKLIGFILKTYYNFVILDKGENKIVLQKQNGTN